MAESSLLITIAAFVFGFGLLVFIHEWGHYSVARLFGVKIDSFAVGMGPELVGWNDKEGVRWKLCAFPIGGYVRFAGDANEASAPSEELNSLSEEEKQDFFHFKPLYQRALVVLAGPVINLVTGMAVFAAYYMINGMQVAPATIGDVLENSPAAEAGLAAGDKIISINSYPIRRFSDIGEQIKLFPGSEVTVVIERETVRQVIPVTLGTRFLEDRFGNRYAIGVIGVYAPPSETVFPGPIEAVGEGLHATTVTIKSIFTTLGQMVMGVRSVREAGGPIRIGAMMGDAANQSIGSLILLLGLISINLGVINLLPIPMLDGGHLFFYIIEAVKGSPLNEKAQAAGFYAGAALMLTLMVLVTLNDLQSIFL